MTDTTPMFDGLAAFENLLGEFVRTHRLPEWWGDRTSERYRAATAAPVALSNSVVKVGAMTETDWREFALNMGVEAERLNRMSSIGYAFFHELMKQNVTFTRDLKPEPPPLVR